MENRADSALKYFRENEAWMEDRIASGIEANRKGWLKLNFVDSEGVPVENVQVTLEQKTHDFKFGCNLFMLDELETAEKNVKFKEMYPQLFNLATLPFYWNAIEPEEGKTRYTKDSPKLYRRPNPDLCIEYCQEHGIEPKLHCLVYDQWTPKWVPRDDVWVVKQLLEKRIGQIAERYRDTIPSMEVTNETVHRHSNPTKFFEEPDMVEWSFARARAHLPTTKLIINEATQYIWKNTFKYNRSIYYMQIERALLKGASIDSIGMQFHMFWPQDQEADEVKAVCNPQHLYRVMDQYADFCKPIQVTEVTVPAYSKEAADEQVQADILRNLYRIWFSHPSMEAIVYWNMVDGYAHGAEPGDMTNGENRYHGGLLRFDMSKKPAWEVLDQLINHDWHTSIRETCSGTAYFKGFYGEYELTATVGGKTVTKKLHLKKGSKNNITITL